MDRRKVLFYTYKYNKESRKSEKIIGEGIFHQWGVDYEELGEFGAGNFSTAIIELPDGAVENVPAQNIKFVATGNKEI